MTMFDDLVAVLGMEEDTIMHAIGRGFKDIESIHFVTGVPMPCIEQKVSALIGIGLVKKTSSGLEIGELPRQKAGIAAPLERKVLVVDDDPDILLFIRDVLEAKGIHVTDATNGKKAIDIIKNDVRGEIVCVITDFFMPQMNGVELCNEVRCTCARKIAMFLMTAYLNPSQLESIDCFDDKFMKPIDIAVLLSRLGTCISG